VNSSLLRFFTLYCGPFWSSAAGNDAAQLSISSDAVIKVGGAGSAGSASYGGTKCFVWFHAQNRGMVFTTGHILIQAIRHSSGLVKATFVTNSQRSAERKERSWEQKSQPLCWLLCS
jgi:hypothetical protein